MRLYLVTAAAYFFVLPLWGSWTVQTDDAGSYSTFYVNFPSAPALALVVPLWAGLVRLTMFDRRLFFEETFAFSAHCHVAWLVLFTAVGLLAALIGRFGTPFYVTATPFVLLVAVPPFYLYSALRAAFGLGAVRALVTAVTLVALHFAAIGVAAALL